MAGVAGTVETQPGPKPPHLTDLGLKTKVVSLQGFRELAWPAHWPTQTDVLLGISWKAETTIGFDT